MLVFVGLGLSGGGLSLEGLEVASRADVVYGEFYTSLVPGFDVDWLEGEIGNSVNVLDRGGVEEDPDRIIEDARDKLVVFLVPGDPMIATTHVDLRLRAMDEGIETRIVHGASIETAAVGEAGLQSYKFGKSATLPFSEKHSEAPYEVLEKNQELGLHTLFLLDIEAEKERYLTANNAIDYLLKLEDELNRNVFTEDNLAIVVARADSQDCEVEADIAKNLTEKDFGSPPHVLIVPGELHFMEGEALQKLANAPQKVVEEYVEE